jgi:pyridinium-3,5-bisthiocarboxylic acid mononucleotide nickel chelatase
MLLAALVDAGADADAVRAGLAGLGIAGLALDVGRTARHGIAARRATVRGAGGQPHRDWASIRGQIDAAGLAERPRARAQEAFRRLAHAEGRVHGIAPEQVHFHEVGALDAIGEVCGVALALESLRVDRVVCSPLPVARGLVDAAHGRLPLPAPATLALLEGAPIHGVDIEAELVTPTGAALIAALADGYGPPPAMTLEGTGYGAGARDLPALPNVVRVLVGSARAAAATRPVSLIEANLDDLLPELAPDAAAACFAAGALDVWTTPAQMKHGRPGFTLSALARPGEESAVAGAMLRETSTLGVRIARLERLELERESRTVEVAGEPVRVKVGRLDGRVVNLAPEHGDCERVARRVGAAVKVVWAQALAAAQEAGT